MKKKLKLSNVTLLAATSSEIDAAQISMRISLHNIKFGAAKLLCSSAPQKKISGHRIYLNTTNEQSRRL